MAKDGHRLNNKISFSKNLGHSLPLQYKIFLNLRSKVLTLKGKGKKSDSGKHQDTCLTNGY